MKITVTRLEPVSRSANLHVRNDHGLVVVELCSERKPDVRRRFGVANATAMARCLSRELESVEVTADSGEVYVLRLERDGLCHVYERHNDELTPRTALNEDHAAALAWALKAAVVSAMEG